MADAMNGADAVVHTAALHAPHVGLINNDEFERINVQGTIATARAARAAGIERFVFTSTTALYGHAITKGSCTWIDEDTQPQPRTIYHRTKLEAEAWLEEEASATFQVRVMRMSRSFPEPASLMALYRLHRGVDARDVADAHVLALKNRGPSFQRYIISGATPFSRGDCDKLASVPKSVLENIAPGLVTSFHQRRWWLPDAIDRVYSSERAQDELGWQPKFGFEEVMRQLDNHSIEVLPVAANDAQQSD